MRSAGTKAKSQGAELTKKCHQRCPQCGGKCCTYDHRFDHRFRCKEQYDQVENDIACIHRALVGRKPGLVQYVSFVESRGGIRA